jgi:hypothetical protein
MYVCNCVHMYTIVANLLVDQFTFKLFLKYSVNTGISPLFHSTNDRS